MDLMSSTDVGLWEKSLKVYGQVVEFVDKQKNRRKGARDKESLASLDQWFQTELPAIVKARDKLHFKKQELGRLMKWKLTRGKFRPRLSELILENSEDQIMEITSQACSEMPNLRKAISTLTKLKAVGPATASAILCVTHPESVPFMADESTMAVSGIGKLDYTLKQYLHYADAICSKAQELNTLDTGIKWTAHGVELALWSYSMIQQHGLDLLANDSGTEKENSEEEGNKQEATPKNKAIKLDTEK